MRWVRGYVLSAPALKSGVLAANWLAKGRPTVEAFRSKLLGKGRILAPTKQAFFEMAKWLPQCSYFCRGCRKLEGPPRFCASKAPKREGILFRFPLLPPLEIPNSGILLAARPRRYLGNGKIPLTIFISKRDNILSRNMRFYQVA